MPDDLGTPAEAYERYIVPGVFGPWTDRLLSRIEIGHGMRVLDLACGTGVVTRRVAELVGADGSIVGIDLSPPMLEVARKIGVPAGGAPVDWKEASALDLPLPDADVDVVVCQQGLQFFPDRPQAVGEMMRVLRPGGRVAVSVWRSLEHHVVPSSLNEAALELLGFPLSAPFSLGDADELRQLFVDAGFEEVEVDAQTAPATFDSPKLYVDVLIEGGAAVIPSLADLSSDERAQLRADVYERCAPVLDRYVEGDRFSFPMTAHIATATKT